MEPISLTKNQEVNNIRVSIADNGGLVLTYTLYTPSLANSDSKWDEKTEIYSEEEIETTALPRIMELYRADIANKKTQKASSGGDGKDRVKSHY